MANFTRTDLTNALAERVSITKSAANAVIDDLFDLIKAEAEAGKTVSIPGFGRFVMKDRAARTGRNPQTGEPIQIPASRVLGFKPSKSS